MSARRHLPFRMHSHRFNLVLELDSAARGWLRLPRATRACRTAALAAVMALPLAAQPQPAATGGEIVALEKLSVEAERLRETFRLERATSATLLSADLRELPLNIAVVPVDLVRSQGIADLKGAVTRISGINTRGGHVRTFNAFVGRGFPIDGERSGYLKNGIPFFGVDAPAADVAHLDRIEYLRGASALLYGAGEPGGAINYVYRAPQARAAAAAEITVGSYDTYRGSFDATGALGGEQLTYRASVGWEDSKGWIDYDYTQKFAPALQLAWQPRPGTRVHLLGELTVLDTNPINADTLLTQGSRGSIYRLPKERYLGHANDYSEERSDALQLTVTHELTPALSLLAQAGLSGIAREQGNTGYFNSVNPAGIAADGTIARLVFDQRRTTEGRYAAVHLNWQIESGGVGHKLLAGVNASEADMHNINGFSSSVATLAPAFSSPVSRLNVFNPAYADYAHLRNFSDSPPFNHLEWTYLNHGLNAQDLVSIPALGLHVLFGGRVSGYELTIRRNQLHNGAPTTTFRPVKNREFIPRGGVVLDLGANTHLFAGYSESFVGPFSAARGENGAILDEPERGVQFEAGVRQTLLDGRVATSLAVYDLTKENVIVGTPTPNVSVQDGEQRSRGVEFDLSGALTPAWNAYFSYAYTDTEVVRSGTGTNRGFSFPGIPKNKVNVWSTYELRHGRWRGLTFGGGIEALDRSPGNANNTFFVPGRVVWDATMAYRWKLPSATLSVQLNLKNAFDAEYYETASSETFLKRGMPRVWLLTTRVEF